MHLRQDVRYALRGFRRAPLVAFTVVSTVGLGLGLVAVAFTIFNMALFREDHVPGVREMYAVDGPRTPDGDPAFHHSSFHSKTVPPSAGCAESCADRWRATSSHKSRSHAACSASFTLPDGGFERQVA